ncbi:hypothetical protein DASC09_052670 [Saccharomycopsis crataegensis]|uniref:Major facilitator superfamily (MFS) profile domain-containing protein n=1 Tax=Saccharomycopsis crataegensis TaxID=43959 RepID=A0AAV5QU74_9ASCO|nr:hypothetical protein DASC09_052670 [Saccharomycopsis crataegensis]
MSESKSGSPKASAASASASASTSSIDDVEKSSSPVTFESHDEKDLKVQQLAESMGINHRKLMWKVDCCVVPPLALLYFLSFLDRVNASNAKVYGITKSLNLTGDQFNTCLTVFFVPYIFFELSSNYALKFVKPHIWLSSCIFFFGCITIGMGFVKNFGQLITCRVLLGVFEASTFCAIFYILSNFYAKAESQKRFSAFFSCTCLAGAAGGAIAYKINDLDGKYGIESWQWIFIIEGTFTAGLALFLYFVVPDFPENCRFLNENERSFIKQKLAIYNGDSGFEFKYTPKELFAVFKDPLIWLTAFAYFGLIIPSYAYAYFAPTIIAQMGYTGVEANQRSIYPWLMAFGWTIIIACISDKLKRRLPFALLNSSIAIVGLAIVLACKHDIHARYAGCFLAVTGLYSAMPSLICWSSLNYGGHLRKAVGTSWQVGFGNIGGIIATYLFLSKDAPYFVTGLSVSIAFVVFAMIFMVILFIYYYKENQKKLTYEYQQKFESLTPREKAIWGDKGPYVPYLY